MSSTETSNKRKRKDIKSTGIDLNDLQTFLCAITGTGLANKSPENGPSEIADIWNWFDAAKWKKLDQVILVLCSEVQKEPKEKSMSFVSTIADATRQAEFPLQLHQDDGIPNVESCLLYLAMTKKRQKKIIKRLKDSDQNNIEQYLLTREEVDEVYQDIDKSKFVRTRPSSAFAAAEKPQILAIDCEMCDTRNGAELTRVSLVNDQHQTVYDQLVLPSAPILDYKTAYSGITPEMMKGCKTTLQMVQLEIIKLVTAQTILAGHSIENDLLSLRILHDRLVDTSLLYPHPAGPPRKSSLRFLSKNYLGIDIQTGNNGHCSEEDAVATMKLVQLKVKKGKAFPAPTGKKESIFSRLCSIDKRNVIIDSAAACRTLGGDTTSLIPMATNGQKLESLCKQLQSKQHPSKSPSFPEFLYSHFDGLTTEEVATYATRVARVCSKQTCSSMLVILQAPCTEDLRELHRLKKVRCQESSKLPWQAGNQERLQEAAGIAQQGQCTIVLHHLK